MPVEDLHAMSSPTPPGQPPPNVPQGPPQGPPQYQQPQYQQQPPYQQQYPQPQYPQQPMGPKKTPAWVWILVVVGVVIVMGIAAVTVGAYFVVKKVQNAGFDTTLMKENPGLAMAKMATALNPDLETVSTNDSAGTIVVREKSTGKTVTMRFDPDKKSLVVVGDDGKEVKFSASGDEKSGSVEVTTADGTLKFGTAANNSAPAWAPVYPGSPPQGTIASQTNDGKQNTFTFKTKDSASKVLSYYQDQLKAANFTIALMSSSDAGGMLQAEDKSTQRSIVITAGTSGDGTEGSVTTIEKK
jgi:hypothetical protein